jgi:hypothetical protein
MIDFDEPISFDAALKKLGDKTPLPTGMSSAELRDAWSPDLRRRSLFSARTTKAQILQTYKDKLAALVRGETNIATVRAQLQDAYDWLGYDPATGFEGDEDLGIPPAEAGSKLDLSSDARIDLVVKTNLQQVQNFAFREAGQTPGSRWSWPCYELVRIAPRLVPRGMRWSKGALEHVEGEDWPSRWALAGGQFYGLGRMIARKDSGIWARLGNSSIFPDALDTSVPPFAFNSGYGWREVSRAECIDLGVIEPDDQVDAQTLKMNKGLSANASKFSTEFLKALRADLTTAINKGRLELK